MPELDPYLPCDRSAGEGEPIEARTDHNRQEDAISELVDCVNDLAQQAIGPTGPQGPVGADGATGPLGAQGVTGLQGTAGPDGPTGPGCVCTGTGPSATVAPIGPEGDQPAAPTFNFTDHCIFSFSEDNAILFGAGPTFLGLDTDGAQDERQWPIGAGLAVDIKVHAILSGTDEDIIIDIFNGTDVGPDSVVLGAEAGSSVSVVESVKTTLWFDEDDLLSVRMDLSNLTAGTLDKLLVHVKVRHYTPGMPFSQISCGEWTDTGTFPPDMGTLFPGGGFATT